MNYQKKGKKERKEREEKNKGRKNDRDMEAGVTMKLQRYVYLSLV
jgi:hypothetical protein